MLLLKKYQTDHCSELTHRNGSHIPELELAHFSGMAMPSKGVGGMPPPRS